MFDGNLAYTPEPQPLPVEAWKAAIDSLKNLGFPQEAILRNYSFSSSNINYPVTVNALAFAHATRRTLGEYAGFTIYNIKNRQNTDQQANVVSTLSESSAPFHLMHQDDGFSFWASTFNDGQIRPKHIQSSISYDQLDNVLQDYAIDLKPQRIIDAKRGRDTFTLPIFRDMNPLQLSIWVTDVTEDLLVEYFSHAVDLLRHHTRNRQDTLAYDSSVTSLSIQLLGAVILSDTGIFGDDARLQPISLSELIKKAQAKFPRYFKQKLFEKYYDAAVEAYDLLRRIRYSSFVPDMLTRIYKAAYSNEQRKKLGRFDTPLYLTRRIWENIPVEYFAPEQRYIADMTCGWGSFLIAGHERLANLSDTSSSLREYLRGNDIDPFTAELAGLGLLLSTSEDSWAIDHGDAFEWHWLKSHQPNIIVGNPPFGADRKKLQADTRTSLNEERTRIEKANGFLKYAIERLASGGYLAMLMPSSFITVEASPKLRKQLLEECDILELWDLPTRIFDASVRVTVIFAQKKGDLVPARNPVRVRTVQARTVKSFKNSGVFTASGLVTDQSAWTKEKIHNSRRSQPKYFMDYKIILPDYKWQEVLSHCTDLDKYAEIIRGAIVGEKKENKRWLDFPSPKIVKWLTGVKKVIKRPFFIDYSQAKAILYPNALEEPRKNKNYPERSKEYLLSGIKVLLVYDPDPTWGKRVKVAIERKEHYVSGSFWVIAPNLNDQYVANYISCEVIAAVLNWHVSNAWIIESLKSPAIAKRAVKTIPFPKNLRKEDCIALNEAVQSLEYYAALGSKEPKEVTKVIDDILKTAYHLDEPTFERLRKISEWKEKTEVTLEIEQNRVNANWFLSGIVSNISAKEGTITFWLEGFDELQTVQITAAMPGWLLRPRAAFCTKIPYEGVLQDQIGPGMVDWDFFRPQPYSYMSEEELLGELTNILQ